MDNDDRQSAIDHALRLLRGHCVGTLLIDGRPYVTKIMIDPRTGSFVFSALHEMLEAEDIVLILPEDRFDAPIHAGLEILTEVEEEACDRFLAYHLDQPNPIWTRGRINFVKIRDGIGKGNVLDQEEIEIPNTLVRELPSLCKKLNSDPKALKLICKLLAKVDVDEPVAVGVDPIGFDVRTRFGIVRVEFPSKVQSAEQAEHVIAALVGGVL
jgi:hypothetical protein